MRLSCNCNVFHTFIACWNPHSVVVYIQSVRQKFHTRPLIMMVKRKNLIHFLKLRIIQSITVQYDYINYVSLKLVR